MKIRCIGGGPAALYFSLLVKKAHPDWDVRLFERNPANVTWGFGVVFSDETMESFREADAPSCRAISEAFIHWDDIHIFFKGEKFVSTGHGFAGMQRLKLLQIIEARARELGVDIRHDADITSLEADTFRDADLIVAADGVNSFIRRQHAAAFGADVVMRPNKFVWLGSTKRFDAFTFYFNRNAHGLWRAHCYQYMPGTSTFIVECTEETWTRAGLADATEADTIAYCERVFAEELDGAKLISNMSLWRNFPRVRNRKYFHDNIVLLGDALHTAHFSIGSGTKLAMEDGIALANALERSATLNDALAAYQAEREPVVDSLQRAAQVSMQWFEETERYAARMEPLQFAYSLLTRSLRINHDNLRRRDPAFLAAAEAWVAGQAYAAAGRPRPAGRTPPPIFTPFRLRALTLENRIVVSPMCQYSAQDGLVGDWHLVHLGSRAIGGAGLVMTEMTCVSPQARITPGCAGIWNDAQQSAWRRIVDFIHANSQAKVGMQIGHAGRKGSTKLLWEGVDQPLPEGNWEVIAPSAIPYQAFCHRPREMTRADMDAVIADHAAAAQRAAAAGFDLLELHMAHGYLLSTFLSPLANRRSDAYGGSIENRMRFPLEVFAAVRAAWPADKPMSVRISATDWKAGGFSDADGLALVAALKAAGCDIVDVSTGQVVGDQEPQYGRLWQLPFSTRLRLEGGLPTMAIGNIQSFGDANAIIAGGRADLCVLARMHLADPYWTRHAAYEYGWPLPWPNPYQSVSLPYTPRWS
jgi:anthraniloyl-CoA monooxygenase